MGIDCQIVDDTLELYVDGEYSGGDNNNDGGGAGKKTGKGTLMDLRFGVVTAPVLYTTQLYPNQLNLLIDIKREGMHGEGCEAV